MEKLKDIVKKNLEELKSSSDAIYFLNTIKALEEINSKLEQTNRCECHDSFCEHQNTVIV